jgi:hypothetical protein
MAVNASVVAYYGEKEIGFAERISEVQKLVGNSLKSRFLPRDLYEVHATVIGLESVMSHARLSDLLRYLTDRFSSGVTIQFGGFADEDYPMSSRGRRLYERAFTIVGSDVMLIGWPVDDQGAPSSALDLVRRECERLGFTHKYYSDQFPADPDCYMSLGQLDGVAEVEACEQQVREYLSSKKTQVPLNCADISIVLYEDRRLPRRSSRVYSL